MNFQTIQEFYELGLWDASQIAELVKVGDLTTEQYQTITGQAYPVPAVEKEPVVSTKPVKEQLTKPVIEEPKPMKEQPVKEENKPTGVAQG